MTTEHAKRKEYIRSFLISQGLAVPASPHCGQFPRATLLRGDNSHARITGKEPYFVPNHGQMGSFGVFFADVLSALMDADILYVFRERDVLRAANAEKWLSYGAENCSELLMRIASDKNLNLRTISGGVTAETELFKSHPIYQPTLGIATIPIQLPVTAASHIFVNKRLLDNIGRDIPGRLAEKITGF